MDELRFVRREEGALIVSTETGTEFRLVVDDTVLSELRHLSRRERSDVRVRPREIQSLIRSGKSQAQVAKETGLEEADIERYAEPVLAERRYILERAQAVPVRADAQADEEQNFGEVIGARLVSLGVDTHEWSAWKEEEGGWMIGLDFLSHETEHQAVWSFEHRKGTLAPRNPDATNLSKQGEVGDRLIPKLRAVDDGERRGRFDSDAFDREELERQVTPEHPEDTPAAPSGVREHLGATHSSARAEDETPVNSDAEYERRREIDQRAVNTTAQPGSDLSQTADLLDALRKRRGERERSAQNGDQREHLPTPPEPPQADLPNPIEPPSQSQDSRPENDETPPRARSIWAAGGVSREAGTQHSERQIPSFLREADENPASQSESEGRPEPAPKPEPRKGRRASIPSWDDILFGTRSDEDPSNR